MPGAPNRPPEIAAAPPPPSIEAPERKLLRRLVPSHVALLLDSWKGPVAAEVLEPFERAETALAAGDVATATSALDLLSIRFAEPRWPTLPEPFRRLRVPIPAPVPPHWDPEHALTPPEKEERRARRTAEDQLLLAGGAVAWADAHGLGAPELTQALSAARTTLASDASGVPAGFYVSIDALWEGLRARLPRPKSGAKRPASAAPVAAEGA